MLAKGDSPLKPAERHDRDEEAPWWGIILLLLIVSPWALLVYGACKAFIVLWRNFDGVPNARYALTVFAIGGVAISAYLVGVTRQIYIEFVVPKLNQRRRKSGKTKERSGYWR
jgi:hypothetical protein